MPRETSLQLFKHLILALTLSTVITVAFTQFRSYLPGLIPFSITQISRHNMATSSIPKTQDQWRQALADLPSTPDNIPAFFFGHGSPMLAMPSNASSGFGRILKHAGSNGPLANFLRDFGPALLEKYKPKGIVVFSAHWDTYGSRLGQYPLPQPINLATIQLIAFLPVTDYGDENPLLMDYYGFDSALYQLKFKSKGDSELSQKIVQAFQKVGLMFLHDCSKM